MKDYVTKIQTKRNNIPRDMFYYFPVLKRRMFMFNGGVNHFDFVTVMIPLANPGGGNLVKIIEKYKKPMFYLIYSELESISGISKNFFKIDNCTLTKDNRLVFKFSLKEHPTEEKEA